MKKILIFNSGSFLYGTERGLLNIVKALKETYEITVVLPGRGPLIKFLRKEGVKIKIFPLAILTLSFSPFYYIGYLFLTVIDIAYFSVYAYFNKIDLLYTNNSLIAFPSLVGTFLGKGHIWHIREFFQASPINRLTAALARRFSSGIICQSKNIKNILFAGTDNNIRIIYEGLSPEEYNNHSQGRIPPGVPEDGLILSLISRIHPLKGQYDFIKLMAEAYKGLKEKVFVLIVGDVSSRNLRGYIYKKRMERFVRKNALEEKILFLGFREDVAGILSRSDICVFPFKRNEPFGLALLEALVFSRQVFLNFNPGSNEIAYFFKERPRKLALRPLREAISKGPLKGSRKIYLPDIFSFENYKRQILAFIKERVDKGPHEL